MILPSKNLTKTANGFCTDASEMEVGFASEYTIDGDVFEFIEKEMDGTDTISWLWVSFSSKRVLRIFNE